MVLTPPSLREDFFLVQALHVSLPARRGCFRVAPPHRRFSFFFSLFLICAGVFMVILGVLLYMARG